MKIETLLSFQITHFVFSIHVMVLLVGIPTLFTQTSEQVSISVTLFVERKCFSNKLVSTPTFFTHDKLARLEYQLKVPSLKTKNM